MTEEPTEEVAVFDIGGTHFRSALWSPQGGLREVRRREAINYLNTPHAEPAELQQALADYIVDEAGRLAHIAPGAVLRASIAMGAPVDARTGLVMQSGPLWGPRGGDFDLLGDLGRRMPQLHWTICNDVTAALVRYVADAGEGLRGRILLITVSTGVGARLYDCARQSTPLDPVHGIQGEIGHLRVDAAFRGTRLSLDCDCGAPSHLNAYASGRGLDALLRGIDKLAPTDLSAKQPAQRRREFASAVRSGDPLALDVLDCATRPLAQILATTLTCDPLIDTIVLTGGVVDALGQDYLDSLDRQFCDIGLFQITSRDPDYLKRRLRLAPPDDHGGLIGAGRLALSTTPPYAFE